MKVKGNKNALAYYSKIQDSDKNALQHFSESCVQQNQLFFLDQGTLTEGEGSVQLTSLIR
jgi:hypothetical protein